MTVIGAQDPSGAAHDQFPETLFDMLEQPATLHRRTGKKNERDMAMITLSASNNGQRKPDRPNRRQTPAFERIPRVRPPEEAMSLSALRTCTCGKCRSAAAILQPRRDLGSGAIPNQHTTISAHKNGGASEAVAARKGLIGVEIASVTSLPPGTRGHRPGIGSSYRSRGI